MNDKLVERVAVAISGAPFPSPSSIRKAKAAIQATGIDEMAEALRPFAEWADWFDSCEQHPAGCPDEAAADEAVEITVGQLRAARTAITRYKGE